MGFVKSTLVFSLLLLLLLLVHNYSLAVPSSAFSIDEATVVDLQLGLRRNQLTSRQLVQFYIAKIKRLNPLLKAVIEVNPDALSQADEADRERRIRQSDHDLPPAGLHGIPILLKDNIATKDKLNTTAGSLALLGSVVPRDAGVVTKLRKAGAIILGKASLSEWAHFRQGDIPSGWCARIGAGKNPYTMGTPCGSSSGSGIAVAANMAAVTLGTETDGSILCPSSYNAVVGIKPTLGLTSRSGVIPISPKQDVVGPMCRTVTDAVYVLDAIAGVDLLDKASLEAAKYMPRGGYTQFLKPQGLKGKRLGILRATFFTPPNPVFEVHFHTFRRNGAVLVDNLKFGASYTELSNLTGMLENMALQVEFKVALNSYLKALLKSPVRSLKQVIEFNNKHAKEEKTKEYGQAIFLAAEATKGIGKDVMQAREKLGMISRDVLLEKVLRKNKLDALVFPSYDASSFLAMDGLPGIVVPAGYDETTGQPFGISFAGLRWSEPKLIEIAYGFEQATKIRKPPTI